MRTSASRSWAIFTALSGFSGVLFGYKVLLTQGAPPEHMPALMGILPLQTRYLVWGELVLIHVMFPSSSFTAHLCGIVAALTISMGWFDAFITAADQLLNLGSNQGAPGGNPQGEDRADNAWQGRLFRAAPTISGKYPYIPLYRPFVLLRGSGHY